MHTQVAILGAGPAGLTLARLLSQQGIDSVVIEQHDQAYVEHRVRAGVLEQGSVDLLRAIGAGDRLVRQGLTHRGIHLQFAGERHRIDLSELTGGRAITVYGRQEIVKDLIALRQAEGRPLLFEASDVALHAIDTERPRVSFTQGGVEQELTCDYIAGCDGFHGASRPAIPVGALTIYERRYPCVWLGILVQASSSSHELIYAYHERGFALQSLRSPNVSRLYLQCQPDEDQAIWSDDRIWSELHARLDLADGPPLHDGPIFERDITQVRSFVATPMQYGRLFLAGGAAHTEPPTGAKGINLAIADARVLAAALAARYHDSRDDLLAAYSATCLRRVWRASYFSWHMTSMLHRFDADPFQHELQLAQLRYTVGSRAAATALAENYVGLCEM
jgi:p-hydroxybenzoate 3-monooxygenase